MDRVDALCQVVEAGPTQPQARLADVAGHHADPRRERLVPDLGLLQGGAQALQSVLAVGGPHQAVHDQIGVLPQQVAQHEPAHEPGRPGQQHLAHICDRHRRGWHAIADGAADERPQAVHVPLALRRQRAGQRRYPPVGWGCMRHVRLLFRPRSRTQITVDELATTGKAVHQLTPEPAKLFYDILVIKIRISGNEVALSFVTSSEMREDGCIDDSILGRETVRALSQTGAVQDRRVERNHFGSTQQPGGYLIQVTTLLLSTAYQQISESVKSAQLSGIGRGPSDLPKLEVKLVLQPLALLLTSREGLVWLGQTIGRHYKPYTVFLAKAQNTLTAFALLLLKGEFQHEVRFDVDVHTTASYSRRPSMTAVRSPESTSLRSVSVSSPVLRADRITSSAPGR